MKRLALVALLAACGGSTPSPIGGGSPDGGGVDGGDPDGGVVKGSPVPLKAAVYKANVAGGVAALVGPAGPAMDTTLIQDWSGSFTLILPDYTFIRGGMYVDALGNLQLTGGAAQIAQDGTVSKTPPKIDGTFNGTTLAATINGALPPVSLAATQIDVQPFTISGMWGKYFSTATNTGTWVAITIGPADSITPPDLAGHIHGDVYITQADMLAGDTSKAIGTYAGTITTTDARSPNTFNIGFGFNDGSGGGQPPVTYGFAYFTANGLVALTGNAGGGGQFSAVFAKQ